MTAPFDLSKFKTKPGGFKDRGNQRIEVVSVELPAAKKRKPFQAHYVQFPELWGVELEKLKSAAAWHLARRILRDVFKLEYVGGPVVLSKEVTGLNRTSRCRATHNLVQPKLIRVVQEGNRAAIVTELLQLEGGKTLTLRDT